MDSAGFVAFAPTADEVAATGEVVGAVDTGLRENQGRLAGLGDAATGDGAVTAVASFFFECFCLPGLGDAVAGDSAAAGVAAGDAAFFLECFALAGLGDASAVAAGVGLWAIKVAAENAARAITRTINLFMA
jgi:hypothetical protein